MRNKSLCKTISILLTVTAIASSLLFPQIVHADEAEQPVLTFPVVSDVHIGGTNADTKFENALQDLKAQFPNYDAIATVGDNTNQGKSAQYDKFMSILNANKVENAESIIAMGNHEYYSLTAGLIGSQLRFVSKTGMPALNYDKWIKGYHFIVLSPENLGLLGTGVILTQRQLTWLDEKLSQNEDNSKPAFVFLHQPIEHTVYGSDSGDNVDNSKQLEKVLKKHSEAVYFSGHSHYILDNQKTMYQDGFTMFNTGAIYYMMEDKDVYADPSIAEGLVVQVYSGKTVVKCREFSQHKWVGQTYTVNYPLITNKQ